MAIAVQDLLTKLSSLPDVVWVAVISSATALVVALLTQFIAYLSSTKSADRLERQAQQQWERSEARRKEEIARAEALRQEDIQRADTHRQADEEQRREQIAWEREQQQKDVLLSRLQKCWAHALDADIQMQVLLSSLKKGEPMNEEHMPSVAAAKALGVALLGLVEIYPHARNFYRETLRAESFLLDPKSPHADAAEVEKFVNDWVSSYKKLEEEIARQTGVIPPRNLTG